MYILESLQGAKLQRVKGKTTTFYQITTKAVHVDEELNPYSLPPECVKVSAEALKSELGKLLKQGREINGVWFVSNITLGMR